LPFWSQQECNAKAYDEAPLKNQREQRQAFFSKEQVLEASAKHLA
jgi:hypothetical protein